MATNNLSDFGIIGLAVMGENLALNVESNGYQVSVFNRTQGVAQRFVEGRAKGKNFVAASSVEEFVKSLAAPRKIMMMIKAGKPVDMLIDQLIPLLDKGDILIDGGNSNFQDSIRRTAYVESEGLLYIGTGVSGGEEGALKGPSIMPGGSKDAWPAVKPIFQSISAKTDDGTPCCDWVGEDGAGHFVKMVHNGIEYGDMQLITEAYQIMKDVLKMSHDEMHKVFTEWNEGDLSSYLIEITRDILDYKDEDGEPLVEKIMDRAGQKGTGKWTGINALDLGIPLTLIGESVFARCLSAIKEERVEASKLFKPSLPQFTGDKAKLLADLKDALYMSKLISYAQGYALMKAAAVEHSWDLNYGGIALMWRGGCIIRSVFLENIKDAYDANPDLKNLLMDPYFTAKIEAAEPGLRRLVAASIVHGIPVPTLSSAISYFDGYRCERLPANLLQAQRDYFGAHTYERVDQPKGKFFHTNWTGEGGDTVSQTYIV